MVMRGLAKQPHKEDLANALDEAPTFERVEWRKEPGLRKLYFYSIVLCVASATTGYDGYAAPRDISWETSTHN
jgi:hypothetical protein